MLPIKNTLNLYSQKWITSPTWDFIWILNCFFLMIAFSFILFFDISYDNSSNLFYIYYAVAKFAAYSHLLAPLLGFFLIRQFWEAFKGQKSKIDFTLLFWTISPAALIGSTFFVATNDYSILVIKILALIYLPWTNWHFGSQNFGVLTLYRVMNKRFDFLDRTLDQGFCILCSCVLIPIASINSFQNLWNYFSPYKITMPVPESLNAAILSIALGLTAALIMYELTKEKISIPRIIYILNIGFQVYMATISFFLFFAFTNLNHWITEIGLVSKVMAGKKSKNMFFNQSLFLGSIVLILFVGFLVNSFMLQKIHYVNFKMVYGSVSDLKISSFGFIEWAFVYVFFTIRYLHMIYDRYIFNFKSSDGKPIREVFFN